MLTCGKVTLFAGFTAPFGDAVPLTNHELNVAWVTVHESSASDGNMTLSTLSDAVAEVDADGAVLWHAQIMPHKITTTVIVLVECFINDVIKRFKNIAKRFRLAFFSNAKWLTIR